MLSQPEFKDMHWTSLQPKLFLPHTLSPAVDFIKEYRKTGKQGALDLFLNPDVAIAPIDPVDVSNVATRLLAQEDTNAYNQARLVLNGPQDLTGKQIVAVVEEYLGKKVESVRHNRADFVDAWAEAVRPGSKLLARALKQGLEAVMQGVQATTATTSKEVHALAPPQITAKQFLEKALE